MTNTPERRAAQRFEILAQASVVSGDDVYLMSVRNVSLSGAFLEGRPKEHPDMKPGVEVEVTLSAASPGMGDDEVVNVRCRGKIARIEIGTPSRSGGFGVTLEPMSAEEREHLEDLLSKLADIPAAERTSSLG
jgi:hypothetical protein